MRYDERFLDEIKSRLRLSDVIGKTVKLRRQGREFVGLSPFNSEKSPSFFVNDEKGFYHDFSSGKHGDLIDFLKETERLTFAEAVERLAGEAGVPLPAPDPAAAAKDRARRGLAEWLELGAAWFEGELRRPGGQSARQYLAGRGLPEADWARFRIGFAPPGRASLKEYLIAKGAQTAELVAAGLLVLPEDGGAPYDRFRDRIIFPIADGRGQIVSFGGRAMDPKARAKYLNGPDTDLFDKGRNLYGLAEARRLLIAAGEDPALVVVEGYMDVIACQRAGIAAVAPMGTALTESQMEMLWRLHPEPTLCFDGDRAGMQAASRAMDRALPLLQPARSLRFATLTGGKDPDDILRDLGPAALKAQLASGAAFVDALFTRESGATALDTPEQRAGLKQRLRAAAGALSDRDLAGAYRDALFARFDAMFAAPPPAWRGGERRSAWRGPPFPTVAGPRAKAAAKRLSMALAPVPAALARRAIQDPDVLDDCVEALEMHGFGDPALDPLAREIIRLRLQVDHLDSEALRRHLTDSGFSTLLIDVDRAAAHAGAPFEKDDVTLAAARSQWLRAFECLHRLAALEDALSAAEHALAEGAGADTLRDLKGKRDALRREIKTGTIWISDAG